MTDNTLTLEDLAKITKRMRPISSGGMIGQIHSLRIRQNDFLPDPVPRTITHRYDSHPFIIWLGRQMRKVFAERWCPDPYIEVTRPNPAYRAGSPSAYLIGDTIAVNTPMMAALRGDVA